MSISPITIQTAHLDGLSEEKDQALREEFEEYFLEHDGFYQRGAGGHICGSTEEYFQASLAAYHGHENSSVHGGYAVFREDDPVGFVKHHRSELMLAISTVRQSDGRYSTIRGHIYLTSASVNPSDNMPRWGYTDASLGVRYGRRLSNQCLSNGYQHSCLEDVLGAAEEAMYDIRENTSYVNLV